MIRRQRYIRISIGLSLVLGMFSVRAFAATISPISSAPEGSIAAPLNTSSAAQTKSGKLGVNGYTTITGDLSLGKSGGTSQICWNDDCRTSWDDVARITGFLRAQPTATDQGFSIISGPNATTDPPAAVRLEAGTPSAGSPKFGLHAIADFSTGADATAKSYAVYGQAMTNRAEYSAVYATTRGAGFDYSANAWAGYFVGNVGVGSTTETARYDLMVGGGTPSNNGGAYIAELCFGGVCRSTWPSLTGGSLWTLSTVSGRNYLRTANSTASLRAGGNGATAPFKVDVTSVAGVPTDASLTVTGPAKFEKYVVGTPTNLTIGQTCGDGFCNNGENDTLGSPNYCPIDCDITAPFDAGADDIIPISACRPPNPCGLIAPYLYIHGVYSTSPDAIGVRVIVRTDRYPDGPFDQSYGGPLVNLTGTPNTEFGFEPSCIMPPGGPTYYGAIFAYDAAGNFAPGVFTIFPCLDEPHL